MKKVMLFLAMLSVSSLCWAASARENAAQRLENATNVLHEIMGMPDKGIPEEVLEHANASPFAAHGQRRLCVRRQGGQRRSHLPHC